MKQNIETNTGDLKFIVHIDSDYTGDEVDDILSVHKLLKEQWETGVVVMPSYVRGVTVLDRCGIVRYEWTRPVLIVPNYPPPNDPPKEKGWFS
jgi:hypothetical protein